MVLPFVSHTVHWLWMYFSHVNFKKFECFICWAVCSQTAWPAVLIVAWRVWKCWTCYWKKKKKTGWNVGSDGLFWPQLKRVLSSWNSHLVLVNLYDWDPSMQHFLGVRTSCLKCSHHLQGYITDNLPNSTWPSVLFFLKPSGTHARLLVIMVFSVHS